jgi:hypothetical protein
MVLRRRSAPCLALPLAVALCTGRAPAQDEAARDQSPGQKAIAAAEAWIATDQSSTEMLGKTVSALLVSPEDGIHWLATELPTALKVRTELRSKGVIALATHVALEFLKRGNASGMVYAGQFLGLQPLQPFVGDLFFMLLLETPDWYPETLRIQLVPALRDLQPQAPDAARLDGVIALVENVEIEPEPLRLALACMLWQWGRREFAQASIDRLQRENTEGDIEDRVRTMLELADLQYRLREYKASAATHRSLESMAESAHYPLKPTDYYSAACVLALSGNVERGIAALEKCAAIQTAPGTDSSHKLERKLFEKDPEIAPLRADPRFAVLFAKLFPKAPVEAGGR